MALAAASSDDASHARGRTHYLQLARSIGIAVATEAGDALAQTAELATTSIPARFDIPVSAAGAVFHEIRDNWEFYRLTPEIFSIEAHKLVSRL